MHLVEDAERAAVDVVADEDVVAALEHQQDGHRRRAAAAERHAVLAALERREAPSERRARGVARARVVEAGPLSIAGPSCANVLERTMGVMTAPWIGSGSWPA